MSVKPTYWREFLSSKGIISALNPPEEKSESKQPREKAEELDRGIFTFIYRVAERLTPLGGLGQEGRRRALKVRDQYQRDLTDVFLGKRDYNDWFNETKTKHSLRDIELMENLYECLEGIATPEARSLRQQYGQVLERMRKTHA